MKIILVILSLVSISPWPLLTSIVAMLKAKIDNFKDKLFNLEVNNLSGIKILSKLYKHKHISKRNYSSRKVINKDSDVYDDYGNHIIETNIYKDGNDKCYLIIGNFTTTNKNVKFKVTEPGKLHKTKAVYMYDQDKVIELKTKLDVNEALNYLKDTKIDSNYTNKIINNKLANNMIEHNFQLVLENKYGCKNLINLTANVTNDKDFNKVLFIIVKDLKNKKID